MSTRFLTVEMDDEAIVELVDEALDAAVLFADVAIADKSSLLLPIDMRNSSCSLVSGDRKDRVLLSLLLLFIFSLPNAKSRCDWCVLFSCGCGQWVQLSSMWSF